MGFVMVVDIGQKRDPTAICAVETEVRQIDRRTETHFLVRYIGRLPLMTPYPDVARRVGEVANGVRARVGTSPLVYVDATGVGQPIVDILREGAPAVRSIVAVYFTYGDRRTEDRNYRSPQVNLGKAYLVSRLQTLLQTDRIHLPRNPETEALAKELLDYEIRVDQNANDRYGAFRVGTHDDLVTALGLAVQTDKPIGLPRSAALSWPPGW